MLTITGKPHALAARPIFTSPGVGTGPPLLSLMVSLGDAASPLEEVKGEIGTEVKLVLDLLSHLNKTN